jgi:type VI secretion system protein ImpK
MNKFVAYQKFQDFYGYILEKKDEATHLYQDVDENKISLPNTDGHFENIQKNLKNLMSRQDVSPEIFYAMCAFVDEIFINLNWCMKGKWENCLLEMHFFSSQLAGEIIFQRIEDLIKAYDSSKYDLAIIYFLILSLGFCGKYQNQKEKIHIYQKILYCFIQKELPNKSVYFFPKCYENTLDGPVQKGLPDVRKWILSIATVIVLYIFLTYLLWHNFVFDVYSFLK